MWRRHPSYAADGSWHLCPACGMGVGSGAFAAGNLHPGFQLPTDLGGDVRLVPHLLFAGKLAETLQGDDALEPV